MEPQEHLHSQAYGIITLIMISTQTQLKTPSSIDLSIWNRI